MSKIRSIEESKINDEELDLGLLFNKWLSWFETEEEAQEEIRRIIKERLSELEKEVK